MKSFSLLINMLRQDDAQQIEVYKVFNLDIPHGNYSLCYDIENKYFGMTLNETSSTEISEDLFQTCKKVNGQFCILNTPLLPLANPPTCVSALYAKDKYNIRKRCSQQVRMANSISIPTSIAPNVWIITSTPAAVPAGITLICPEEEPRTITPQTPIHILCLQPACSATSQHFHLPPSYESHEVTINISLNTANLNVVNILGLEFRIWHLEAHWNRTSLQHLANILSMPFDELCKKMFTSNRPMNPFLSTDRLTGETVSVWTLFSHTGVYIKAIRLLIPPGLGIFFATFLVLTCQISTLTFTIRFYVIYYCG